MADHSLFVFVRVQGATPEAVGNALKDGSDKILDIYSIMGEWDLLVRIEQGQIDPSFVITHRAKLKDGPQMYRKFRDKEDGCIKVVLQP